MLSAHIMSALNIQAEIQKDIDFIIDNCYDGCPIDDEYYDYFYPEINWTKGTIKNLTRNVCQITVLAEGLRKLNMVQYLFKAMEFLFEYNMYYKPFVVVPLACVGMLGNVVSFWVWLAEKRKSTTTLLFMYLAVVDLLYLVFKSLDAFDLVDVFKTIYAIFLAISAHTTALIAANRWCAIWKPMHVHTILTRARVITLCVVTSLWATIVRLVDQLLVDINYLWHIILEFVVFLPPFVALLLFTISILWMSFRHRRYVAMWRHDGTFMWLCGAHDDTFMWLYGAHEGTFMWLWGAPNGTFMWLCGAQNNTFMW
jgi:hypothetical protein